MLKNIEDIIISRARDSEKLETLRLKYKQFIQTEKGKEWKHFWQTKTGSQNDGDFGDYLYDFYPEMLQ